MGNLVVGNLLSILLHHSNKCQQYRGCAKARQYLHSVADLGVGVQGGLLAPNAGRASATQAACKRPAVCCTAVELCLEVLQVEPASAVPVSSPATTYARAPVCCDKETRALNRLVKANVREVQDVRIGEWCLQQSAGAGCGSQAEQDERRDSLYNKDGRHRAQTSKTGFH